MKIFCIALFSFSTLSLTAAPDKLISKQEYSNTWKQIAIRQMIDFKIPASITLAQGILESASGNSDLAVKGNNHFGIKCGNWTGEKMYKNDDSENECFRVYMTSEESYLDHSKFLTSKTRYAKLFTLDITDYKSWAIELKNAGYATNPKYPDLLIEIIESLKLNEIDHMGNPVLEMPLEFIAEKTTQKNTRLVEIHANKVKYIVARKGDTFYKIAKEFNLGLWQLYKYNDFNSTKDLLIEGDIVYIQPKRRRSKNENNVFQITKATTLRQISQMQAIKLESLLNMNNSENPDAILPAGEVAKIK
jgi:LysM repeat protein